jgi:hypothetical protein
LDAAKMTKATRASDGATDRRRFAFAAVARKAFGFLIDRGFREIEAVPTLLRYRNDGIEFDVYHGRQSYEIGAGISAFGERYSISEVFRLSGGREASNYRYRVATTSEALEAGLRELSRLTERSADAALRGDPEFFRRLAVQRREWAEKYADEVKAANFRPKAEASFRQGDYERAAEFYASMGTVLSPAEARKLDYAKRRAARKNKL